MNVEVFLGLDTFACATIVTCGSEIICNLSDLKTPLPGNVTFNKKKQLLKLKQNSGFLAAHQSIKVSKMQKQIEAKNGRLASGISVAHGNSCPNPAHKQPEGPAPFF